jgi:hypothetical protein
MSTCQTEDLKPESQLHQLACHTNPKKMFHL